MNESTEGGRSAEERREIRNARSRPLLESLKQWFEQTLGKLSTKSGTTKAIRYALGRWEALMRFCDDGHLEIDNNATERHVACSCFGKEELFVSWIGRRGRTRSGDLWPDRNSKTQRAQR
jgi:hypothetical protein